MKGETRIWIIIASIASGLVFMIITTELLNRVVWPSLLIGVPTGIIASIVTYLILKKAARSN